MMSFFSHDRDDRTLSIRIGDDSYQVPLRDGQWPELGGASDVIARASSVLELFPKGFAVTGKVEPIIELDGRRRVDLVLTEPVDDDLTMYVYEMKGPRTGGRGDDRVDIGTIEGHSTALAGLDEAAAHRRLARFSGRGPGKSS